MAISETGMPSNHDHKYFNRALEIKLTVISCAAFIKWIIMDRYTYHAHHDISWSDHDLGGGGGGGLLIHILIFW